MKRDITITAEARTLRGKNEARRLRVRGLSPAVLYGAEKDSTAIAVSPKEVNRILHSSTGKNTIFSLAIQDGETTPVMIVDWQNDPVKSNLLHVDLKRIDLTKRIAVRIPVHTKGEPKGVKLQGGLLELITRDVEIECLPDEIPEQFTVDITELMIGQSVRAGDIPLGGTMKLLGASDLVLAHVVSLRAEEVAAVEAAPTGAAEPEVIKKGKKDEEGAPAAAEAKPKAAAEAKPKKK
jgi:large subunit ribosomal protein L25